MKRKTFAVIIGAVLLATAPGLAYPPVHTPNSAPIYQETGKRGLADYDQIKTGTLETYGTEQRNSKTFDLYRDGSGNQTFVDLKERNSRDPAFELYHKVEKTYEKTPRFSY